MKELTTCVQFQSDSALTMKEDNSNIILEEQKAITAIHCQDQVSCIKSELRSVADLQEDLKDNVILKTESTFCSYADKTYCSQITFELLENSSVQTPIKHELATHIHQSNWKHDDTVKMEFSSQDAICCIKTEEVPCQELHHIKVEHAAHIEQSDCRLESAVKLEYHSQDVTCLIRTEQDPVHSAKTEEQRVVRQEEQGHSQTAKTETDWPGQHAMWQHDSGEKFEEMSAARCKTPEVMDIITESQQHQTHPTVTEVTIDSATGINSNAKPYHCIVCLSSFRFPSTLANHILTHSDERSYRCSVCHKAFKTPYNLRSHMLTHSDESPHQCSVCKKAYKTPYNLRSHMLTHSDESPHQCSVCKKAYKISQSLKQHMQTHSDESPPQCSVCKKAYKTPNYLRTHMLTHSDESPHQCSVCKKAYQTPNNLRTHMLTHSDESPHRCSVCKKAYKTPNNLRSHMLTHSDERPHQCSVCKKAFKTSQSLKHHMQIHSDGRLHQCFNIIYAVPL